MGSCLIRPNFRNSHEGPSDDFLVNEARRGHEPAIAELWSRYGSVVRSKIWRITGNWEDTEDVLQETYLNSYVHLNQFNGRSKFSTWLIRIAINSALMHLRKRRRRLMVLVENDDLNTSSVDFPDRREDAESSHFHAEYIEHLRTAVHKLRPPLRHIFELQYERDLSVEDIAKMTSISVPAVKSRLLRARAQLRDYLSPLRSSLYAMHQSGKYSSSMSHSRRSGTNRQIERTKENGHVYQTNLQARR